MNNTRNAPYSDSDSTINLVMDIIVEDAPVEPYQAFPGSKSLSSDIYWTTENVPDNDIVFKDHAKEHAREFVGPAGNAFKVIDMPPGQKSVLSIFC